MLKAKGDWMPLNRFDFFLPAYIFVVDNENFKTCVERGVCDCPRHESPKIDAKAIDDLAGI
jgi:hypothetical protein